MQTLRQKLEKCCSSMKTFADQGGGVRSKRGMTLIDRYGELVEVAKGNEASWAVWQDYCRVNMFDLAHDGYDFFA